MKNKILLGLLATTIVGCSSGGSDSENGNTGNTTQSPSNPSSPTTVSLTTSVSGNGSLQPASTSVHSGSEVVFTVVAGSDSTLESISGCGGSTVGNTYVVSAANQNCEIEASFAQNPTQGIPQPVETLSLNFEPIKRFNLTWESSASASHYKVLENIDGASGYQLIVDDIEGTETSSSFEVPLYQRIHASYIVQSCNDSGCADSDEILVRDNMAGAIGYLKASALTIDDEFGFSVAVSADGSTVAVGMPNDDSRFTGDPEDNSSFNEGSVHVFSKNDQGVWQAAAYLRASNIDATTGEFGYSVDLSNDGKTLVAGAPIDFSDGTGVNGEQTTTNKPRSGAAHVFRLDELNEWVHTTYLKQFDHYDRDENGRAIREVTGSRFGSSVSISGDGSTIAVGRPIDGVYTFERQGDSWVVGSKLRPSNYPPINEALNTSFGVSTDLSFDGSYLIVGDTGEGNRNSGINPESSITWLPQTTGRDDNTGAAYVFERTNGSWDELAYIKASNPDAGDQFGASVAISSDGTTMAVSAPYEDGFDTGINGDQDLLGTCLFGCSDVGAVYLFALNQGEITQTHYVKPGHYADFSAGARRFGTAIDLSGDGSTLVVGMPFEETQKIGIHESLVSDNTGFTEDTRTFSSFDNDGILYVFNRDTDWTQEAMLTSPVRAQTFLGMSTAISADGNTIIGGATAERGASTGINGDANDRTGPRSAGSAYIF